MSKTRNADKLSFCCSRCHHQLSAFRALTQAGLWPDAQFPSGGDPPINLARMYLKRMRCTECGHKDIELVVDVRRGLASKFVASDRSPNRVFHGESCYFAGKIAADDAIYFSDWDDATRQGFQPCRSCRPRKS